jgi:hypothetical protein
MKSEEYIFNEFPAKKLNKLTRGSVYIFVKYKTYLSY